MSKFLKIFAATFLFVTTSGVACAETLGLGRTALPEEIAAWDIEVSPDGTGLPVGSGDAIDGEELFADSCASCHGDFAEGIDNWPKLAGGADTLDHENPLKTVGSYWPHLTTTYDYVRRSMPYGFAGSLSDDDVYAIVAYILYSNDIIDDDFVITNENLLDIVLPNSDGFIIDDRDETEYPLFAGEPCMSNCKETVEVTMRALVLDVTPGQSHSSADEDNGDVAMTAEPEVEQAPIEVVLDPELVSAGEKVFRKCRACHKVGEGAKNASGPVLNGIVAAPAGQVEGYKYSKALLAAADEGLVWTEDELRAFLAKPKAHLKGTKMSFAGLRKDADLDAIIAYLQSVGE